MKNHQTKEAKSYALAKTNAIKSNTNKATFQFKDKRPEGIIQRKLSEITNNPSNHSTQVIQRNKHLKRFKNVMTLGLRKPYVKHRRANRAPAVPAVTPLDQFVEAYEKSRYYHQTHADNLDSINEHGLLNYKDREKKLPEQVAGMSRVGGEFEGDEKKGVFLGPKHFMKSNEMTKNMVRAFLPKQRTKIHHWTEEETTPSHEMFRDEKFRGGAVITKDSIPPEQITTQPINQLLEEDNPRLTSILQAVGSQYENESPTAEDMKAHLQQAILERKLSNVAFDDVI